MISLAKNNKFVGTVPFMDRYGKNVIGTAKVEETRSGYLIAHIDAGENPEAIIKGFSFGELSIEKGEESSAGFEG